MAGRSRRPTPYIVQPYSARSCAREGLVSAAVNSNCDRTQRRDQLHEMCNAHGITSRKRCFIQEWPASNEVGLERCCREILAKNLRLASNGIKAVFDRVGQMAAPKASYLPAKPSVIRVHLLSRAVRDALFWTSKVFEGASALRNAFKSGQPHFWRDWPGQIWFRGDASRVPSCSLGGDHSMHRRQRGKRLLALVLIPDRRVPSVGVHFLDATGGSS